MSRAANTKFEIPTRAHRLKELRTPREAVRQAVLWPKFLAAPTGDGRATLLFPGFGTNDLAMIPLRSFLSNRGHRAEGWGLGTNNGDIDRLLEGSADLVRQRYETTGRKVNIVGWSLGGVFAREIARELPAMVHKAATFGTPLHGPRFTGSLHPYSEAELQYIESQIEKRRTQPIEVPLTTIYSSNDGIVNWQTCIDHESPNNKNVKVTSTHIGMGVDPEVWLLLAEFFAEG